MPIVPRTMPRTVQKAVPELPTKGCLRVAYYTSSAVVALICATASLGLTGILDCYPTREVATTFIPNDIANLAIGMPLLITSMLLARSGILIGLLSWPGMLLFTAYSYFNYIFGVPLGPLFIPHLLILSLSIYSLIGIIASIDSGEVKRRLTGCVRLSRFTAGLLIVLSVFIFTRQMNEILKAMSNSVVPSVLDIALFANDFLIAAPVLLIGGVLLWRRHSLGYATAAALLLQFGLLSLSVVPVLIYQAHEAGEALDVDSLVAVLVMAVICLVPFALFARAAGRNDHLTTH